MAVKSYLADIWSATEFRSSELDGYAEEQMRTDVRQGVRIMAMLSLSMQTIAAILAWYSGAGSMYLYTNLVLGTLSLHVLISANYITDIRALQMLGMILLLITALAITFLAHRNGNLHVGMMAAVIMLFIAIPLVPWALREAVTVIGLTYGLLTASLASVPGRFQTDAIWALQLLIIGSAIIVTIVIGRNTFIRKQDIRSQFQLENAHREMELLSMKDHLTGAWNRRFLEKRLVDTLQSCCRQGKILHVAVLDVDDFKGVNDQFGHDVGDDILQGLGEIFVEMLADDGWFIRLGGDEFQIFYCGDGMQELIGKAIARLHDMPVAKKLDGMRTITLSAGFTSTSLDDPIDLNGLYKAADEALYHAKNNRTACDLDPDRTGTWKL